MKKNIFVWGLLAVLCSSCAMVPLTGRTQLGFIPAETMLSMSYQQHEDFLKSNKTSADGIQSRRVQTVGTRIQNAVEQYMSDNGLAHRLKNYQWEFTLIEDEAVNAWCMPGGKVVVYTGILPVAGDDNGLAVVIAHEIAHAIAEHGNERMSQAMLAQLGGTALSVAMQNKPAFHLSKTSIIFMKLKVIISPSGSFAVLARPSCRKKGWKRSPQSGAVRISRGPAVPSGMPSPNLPMS
jgi:predicted Zn-dependent protease